jgi:hypothetical protein
MQAAAAQAMEAPRSVTLTGIRGTKFSLDASGTRTPPGTQIVSYQWRVVNSSLSSNDALFVVNTSLLPPGNYTIQLVVVNDRGRTATQQYPLTVDAGVQPAEIIRQIATAYESLQPNQFLKYFDDQKFRNYSGFAAAIEDSFRSQLETVRVFQRPVNCTAVEEQDQAVCQADFELRFTKKDQPTELLDAQGNPIPPGVTPPPGAMLGKRIQIGTERTTIRFERGNAGWKVVDYSAVVSCPGGTSTTGVNVGSCVLALGTAAAPSFQIINLLMFSTDLPLGGSVSGTFEILPLGGFSDQINFTAQGQISDRSITAQFTPNPSGPSGKVNFTVFSPSTVPTRFSGAQPFTLVITGQASGTTVTGNVTLTLQPNYNLSLSPVTSSSAPAPVTHNSTLQLGVQVVPGPGFSGTVFIDFPNLPTGFRAASANVAAGATVTFPVQVTAAAAPGPAYIVVRGSTGTSLVKTATLFVDVISDFTLTVSAPSQFGPSRTLQVSVSVVPISGFAGTVVIDFPGLPAGFQVTPATASVPAGSTATFTLTATATAPPGPTQFTVRGTFTSGSSQTVKTVTIFAQAISVGPVSAYLSPLAPATVQALTVTGASNGPFYLTTNPVTTPSSPILLPESPSRAFVQVLVHSDGNFSGPVKVTVNTAPNEVTPTLVRSAVDLTGSAVEVVDLHFQRGARQAASGSLAIVVAAASGRLTATTTVFVAVPAASASSSRGAGLWASAPRIGQVRPSEGIPGTYTRVAISGEGLSSITGALSDSSKLTVALQPAGTDSQIVLNIFIKPEAAPGRQSLMLVGSHGSLPIPFEVKPAEADVVAHARTQGPPGPRPDERYAAPVRRAVEPASGEREERRRGTAQDSPGLADLAVRAEDVSMSPANPRQGDRVTFRVRVTNEGTQRVEDALIEFTIAGTNIRQREHISLAPKASQTFLFEWEAAGNGRFTPSVVIDPEHRLRESNRANNAVTLPTFELAHGAGAGAAAGARASARERAHVRVAVGGCVGFRLAAGTEQACNANADFELRSSPDGTALLIQADGVRNLGPVALDQAAAPPGDLLATTETVQPGSTYVIQMRRGLALLRVVQLRGLGAARRPPSLNVPRARGQEGEARFPGEEAGVQVWLEWKIAGQQ